MAVLDTNKTKSNLKKKGFVESNTDHKRYEFYYDNKFILYTKVSHGAEEIGDFLIKKMSEQCKLNKSDFKALVDCTLDHAGYLKKLKEQKIIQ